MKDNLHNSVMIIDPISMNVELMDKPFIRNPNQAIPKILDKIPGASNGSTNTHSKADVKDSRPTVFQHPARSNTPLLVKQKINAVPESRVPMNGLDVIKHANMNANSQ